MFDASEGPFLDLNDQELDELIANSNKPILALFTARWCAPCQWIEPELFSLGWRYRGALNFARLDVDASPLLAARYRINCLPAVLLITEAHAIGLPDKMPECVVGYQTAADIESRLGLARYRPNTSAYRDSKLEFPLPMAVGLNMDDEAFGYGQAAFDHLPAPMTPEPPGSLILREPGLRQEAVRAFHAAFNNTIGATSAIRDAKLRWSLIDEERNEVITAIEHRDLADLGGEISDLLYVIYGSAVTFGLLLPDITLARRAPSIELRDPATQVSRVNRSVDRALRAIGSEDIERARQALQAVLIALAHVEADCGIDLTGFFAEVHRANMDKIGGERRPDGKRLKPAGWRAPDLAGVLAAQIATVGAPSSEPTLNLDQPKTMPSA